METALSLSRIYHEEVRRNIPVRLWRRALTIAGDALIKERDTAAEDDPDALVSPGSVSDVWLSSIRLLYRTYNTAKEDAATLTNHVIAHRAALEMASDIKGQLESVFWTYPVGIVLRLQQLFGAMDRLRKLEAADLHRHVDVELGSMYDRVEKVEHEILRGFSFAIQNYVKNHRVVLSHDYTEAVFRGRQWA